MLPMFVADAWFTIGPVLVIVLAGAQDFAWSHWPVYAVAFVAQVAVRHGRDARVGVGRRGDSARGSSCRC